MSHAWQRRSLGDPPVAVTGEVLESLESRCLIVNLDCGARRELALAPLLDSLTSNHDYKSARRRAAGYQGAAKHAARHLGQVVEAGNDEEERLAGAAEAAEDEDLLAHEPRVAADLQRLPLVELLTALQERQQLLRGKLRIQLHLHRSRSCSPPVHAPSMA